MHAALDDDLSLRLGRFARELQAVTDEIRDAIVDFRRLIVVSKDDRAALLLERIDGPDVGREERPFDRGNDGLDPLIEMRGFASNLVIPVKRRARQHAEVSRGAGSGARRAGLGRSIWMGWTERVEDGHCSPPS